MEPLRPGIHERLVTEALERAIEKLGWNRVSVEKLGKDEAELLVRLATQHLAHLARDLLGAVGAEHARERVPEIVNRLLEALGEAGSGARLAPPARVLRAVAPAGLPVGTAVPAPIPAIPLSETAFLANARREPSILHVLREEIRTADRVDAVIAFLRWTGYLALREDIEAFLRDRPGRMRVVTSTYLGATSRRVVDELCRLGAEVRVGWDPRTTPLHAKAWIFHRESGFTTAVLGSSNLSHRAITDGLEWNLRLSSVENPFVVERMTAVFEQYWESPDFSPYDPGRDGDRLAEALGEARGAGSTIPFFLDVRPWPFQREILDRLAAERQRGYTRNLVVAPTGTGKTVVAALDYRRLRERERRAGRDLSLLFVAHRKEILLQAQATFRQVLRDPGFGELLVDGNRPTRWNHVFASVQSLSRKIPGELAPDRFGMVIVDEIHHAAARTWEEILDHFRPRWLLGLTATPERADGRSILGWFDGRVAAEMRLWHALERQLLAPFRYLVVEDGTDLRGIGWSRGRFVDSELEGLYTGNDARARKILDAVRRYVEDPGRMRALGFCVGQAHARFMARKFEAAGLPARAVTADTPREEREKALQDLREGRLRAIFSVDLFNEGLDVPAIDTVLFLRPTESATVFLQQLGRGLRHAEDKDVLLVLDFVGQVDRKFRFDRRFRALLGGTGREVLRQVEKGFPTLPPGCAIVLEERAREIVLRNIRENLDRAGTARVLEELGDLVVDGGVPTLGEFLERTGLDLEDVYGKKKRKRKRKEKACWTSHLREKGLLMEPPGEGEEDWYDLPGRLLHVDDPVRLDAWRRVLAGWLPGGTPALEDEAWRRFALVAVRLEEARRHNAGIPLPELPRLVADLRRHPPLIRELKELLELLGARPRDPRPPVVVQGRDSLLALHARYTRREVMAVLGILAGNGAVANLREGVVRSRARRVLALFVNLDKSEKGYIGQTRYRDYAISPRLFHWESQVKNTADGSLGRLYREHRERGWEVLLFVRERPKDDRGLALPFACLGQVLHVRSEGECPISILWRLEHPMPADLFEEAKAAAS